LAISTQIWKQRGNKLVKSFRMYGSQPTIHFLMFN